MVQWIFPFKYPITQVERPQWWSFGHGNEGVRVQGGVLSRVTILAEWLRHFNGLAVGETAAPACFLRENAEGAGMPPMLSH